MFVLIVISLIVGLVGVVWNWVCAQGTKSKKGSKVSQTVVKHANVNQSKYQESKSHYEDLKLELLSGIEMGELKQSYDKVMSAIYSIPPAIRDNATSHPLWRLDLSRTNDSGVQWCTVHVQLCTVHVQLCTYTVRLLVQFRTVAYS